jgi:hypothetical protein
MKSIEELSVLDQCLVQVLADTESYNKEGASIMISRLSMMLLDLGISLSSAQSMLADFYTSGALARNLDSGVSIH